MDIVGLSKKLMKERTKKNRSPVCKLTEIAIRKGKELSKKYDVDEKLVLTSLYLAHAVFSPVWKDDIQRNHEKLSSDSIKTYLDRWKVSREDQEIIINSIEAHHNKIPAKSRIAEVVKNAECFKFVTLEGSRIFFKDLVENRNISRNDAIDMVIEKMEQKRKLLTFEDCKKEAEKNCKEILGIFNIMKRF